MRAAARFALAAGAALGGLAVASRVGVRAWERETTRMAARVAGAAGPRTGVYRPEALPGLPAPVVRYFEYALTPGQPMVRTARVEHRGDFRGGRDAGWSPFRSTQLYSADPPGFVWDARIEMVPLVGVRVRDGYLAGEGSMLARAGGLVTVVDRKGGPELASGALHRYLAESAWLPTALLPRPGLAWEAVDDSTARVTLRDAGRAVSLDVHFDASGGIVGVEAERYRDVDGVGVLTPFVGHFRDYATVQWMRIPMRGEVEWILPEGRLSYWRGRVERAGYTFAR